MAVPSVMAANVASIEAAFAEAYAAYSLSGLRVVRLRQRNWWELAGLVAGGADHCSETVMAVMPQLRSGRDAIMLIRDKCEDGDQQGSHWCN
jgi:hypothetical protein